jgi:hypothetical protein
MVPCYEINAFLTIAEGALDDPIAGKAQHIRSLPAPVQIQLAKAISSIAQNRFEGEEMKRAAEVISGARKFSGGLGEAVQAITHTLIDNGGFEIFRPSG